MVDTTGQSDVDYYYAHDHLYSSAALIEDDGDVIERYEGACPERSRRNAYGNVHIMDGNYNSRSSTLYNNPYTFTGRRLDSLDSGKLNIMYYRHRSYHPQLGRFLQHDPVGLIIEGYDDYIFPELQYLDGVNLYEFANSNVISRVDPYGLYKLDSSCKRCGKYPGGDGNCDGKHCWPPDTIDAVEKSVKKSCDSLDRTINSNGKMNYKKLLKCLKKRCKKNGTLACDKCKKKGKGGLPAGGSSHGKTACLFLNNFVNGRFGEDLDKTYGDVAIHEWAETCGWNHGDGHGVPEGFYDI